MLTCILYLLRICSNIICTIVYLYLYIYLYVEVVAMYALSAMHAYLHSIKKKKYNGQDELSWIIIQAIYFLIIVFTSSIN